MYTLAKFYEEAHIANYPAWAKNIPLRRWDAATQQLVPLTPRRHQVTGLNLCMYYERSALYDEQGTGKTLIAQAKAIWHAAQGDKVVALMPPVLLSQFEQSLETSFGGIRNHVWFERYQGAKAKRHRMLEEWYAKGRTPDILAMTYNAFRDEMWVWLKENGYVVLVCDEATILKNPGSTISGVVDEFLGPEGERGLLLMTGTPAHNHLVDLYGYIHLITPTRYGSLAAFYRQHVDVEVYGRTEERPRGFEKIVGYRNLDLMYAALYAQARRVTKEEALDLPEREVIEIPVDLDRPHYTAYRKLVEERILEFPDGSVIDATNSSALRQITLRAVLNPRELGIDKQSAVVVGMETLLESLGMDEEKVVVFCYYNESVASLRESFAKYNPAVIYGGTTNKEREKQKFLRDASCRMLIANYVAGGVGVDGLQGVSRYIVCAEPISVPGDYQQAIDRLHRSGQDRKVTVYIFTARGTTAVTVKREMFGKRRVNNSVVSRDQLRAGLLGEDESREEVLTQVAKKA